MLETTNRSDSATGTEEFLVFSRSGSPHLMQSLEGGRVFNLWRPSLSQITPPTLGRRAALCWLAHYCHVFRNRDYSVLLIKDGDRFIHRSCAIPACFRWPFMDEMDIQISSTWTEDSCRGQGLATIAIGHLITVLNRPKRTFWYLARANNKPSVAVCQKAGFKLVGKARRTKRLGLRLWGTFELVADSAMEVNREKLA